jgi:hypothetical protein
VSVGAHSVVKLYGFAFFGSWLEGQVPRQLI